MSQERYYWLKAHGICVQCGQKDAFPGYTKCPECIEKAEEASRKYGIKMNMRKDGTLVLMKS